MEDEFNRPDRHNDGYIDDADHYLHEDTTFVPDAVAREEFGNGGDLWLEDIRSGSQVPEYRDTYEMNEIEVDDNSDDENPAIGSYVLRFAKESNHSKNNDTDIFAYFDENIKKNWAGTQNWKIERMKRENIEPKRSAPTRQAKKKEDLEINFLEGTAEDDIFDNGNPSSIQLARSQWRSDTRNLLPDDINFNSKNLLRLFLKPQIELRFLNPNEKLSKTGTQLLLQTAARNQEFGSSNIALQNSGSGMHDDDDNVGHFGYGEHIDDSDVAFQPNYDANFFDERGSETVNDPEGIFVDAAETLDPLSGAVIHEKDLASADSKDYFLNLAGNRTAAIKAEEEFEFGSQLVLNSSRTFKADYVNYARVAKKVDVKRLKDNLWIRLESDETAPNPVIPESRSKSSIARPENIDSANTTDRKFSELVGGLSTMYPTKALADISTSFCFICLLHLANERGLSIENDADLSDLAIRRDPEAVIEQY